MYSAFIVDDEAIVRNGLKTHFNWAKYNVTVTGEAENGMDALKQILEHPVDIVISDVRMPFLDGIALAKALKERDCPAKMIFISGYDDIEYLKSALKIDAIDYILKSIDLDEFEETIKKVVSIIETERAQNTLLAEMENRLKQSIPLLQEKLLLTLIRDDTATFPMLEERIEFLGLNLKPDINYCIAVLKVQNYYALYSKRNEHGRQQLTFAVLNICEETVKKYAEGIVFESGLGEFTIILPVEQEAYEVILLDLAKELQALLKKYLDMVVIIGLSQRLKGYRHFMVSYQSAVSSILATSSLGRNKSVTINRHAPAVEDEPLQAMHKKEEALRSALSSGSFPRARALLSELLTLIDTIADEYERRSALFHLMLFPEQLLISHRIRRESPYCDMRLLCEQFFCCQNTKEISSFVLSVYAKVENLLNFRRDHQTDVVIAHMKQIMNERFSEALTIVDLANEVYLTPTYICLLFKQETGMTINDYLTVLRLEHAKKLLADPKMKLYDICYSLGYTSPSYFSRLFKKHTGLSPSEYRDTVIAASIAYEE